MTEQDIMNLIPVGLRKGVDGEGSGRYRCTINDAYDSQDKRIIESVNKHLFLVAQAALPLIEQQASDEEIGQAMKTAACQLTPPPENTIREILPYNEGQALLKQLTPIDTQPRWRIDNAVSDEEENTQFWTPPELRTQIHKNGVWENYNFLSQENILFISATLLKLAKEVPEVKTRFEEVFIFDYELEFRTNLQKYAQKMTDYGWECLAFYIKDILLGVK